MTTRHVYNVIGRKSMDRLSGRGQRVSRGRAAGAVVVADKLRDPPPQIAPCSPARPGRPVASRSTCCRRPDRRTSACAATLDCSPDCTPRAGLCCGIRTRHAGPFPTGKEGSANEDDGPAHSRRLLGGTTRKSGLATVECCFCEKSLL